MLAEICIAVVAGGPMCERSLEALDKQYNVGRPLRELERWLTTRIPLPKDAYIVIGYALTQKATIKLEVPWP